MPFHISETINQLSDSFLGTSIVRSIANNPVYTALIMVVAIMCIVAFVFRDVESDDSFTSLVLRSGFWTFMFLVGTLLLHNKVLVEEMSVGTKVAAYEDIFVERDDTSGFNEICDFTKI